MADSNKCFSLWLNSARKKVYDKVQIYVENHKAFNGGGGGVKSKDHFSINAITKQITGKITEQIISDIVAEYKNKPTTDESDPNFEETIGTNLKQACERTFVSATFIDDKHTNDFNETTGVLYNINYKNDKIKILAANNTDAMTSNIDHFVVPDIVMTSGDAFDMLCKWDNDVGMVICAKIDMDSNLNEDEKDAKISDVEKIIDKLETNRAEIKIMCGNLYKQASSTKAKAELEKHIDNETRKLKPNASPIAKLKYDILAKNEEIIKAEKQLEKLIEEYTPNDDIVESAFGKYADLERKAKKNYEQYKKNEEPKNKIFFRKNEAAIAEEKNWNKYYPDLLKSAYFASNIETEANKRSEYAGFMNIGLRYFFDNEKQGKEMEKNRFYVFSKNMPKLEAESDEEYYKRILDATIHQKRNEIIVALKDIETMQEAKKTNQTYYYGKADDNAMKAMDFYVPNLDLYNGTTPEEKAKDALFSKDGIKQMLPMINFFGKNAFQDGICVYSAKDMKHYEISDFLAIKIEMQKLTLDDSSLKLTDDLANSEYLAKQQKILEYQSDFTQKYLTFVRQQNLDSVIDKKCQENEELFKNLPNNNIALMQILAKKQSDVHDSQNARFASPTPTPRVSSSIKQGPALLLARHSANANRLPQNQNAEITTITHLPQSGTINYNSAYNTPYPTRIPSATQRPPSSTTPAGFRTGSGRLLPNRPPSAQQSSVPALPQILRF